MIEDSEGIREFLPLEVNVLNELHKIGAKYYPKYQTSGGNEHFNFIVTQLAGKSIETLRQNLQNMRFSLRTCLHIGIWVILSLEEIHLAGLVNYSSGQTICFVYFYFFRFLYFRFETT